MNLWVAQPLVHRLTVTETSFLSAVWSVRLFLSSASFSCLSLSYHFFVKLFLKLCKCMTLHCLLFFLPRSNDFKAVGFLYILLFYVPSRPNLVLQPKGNFSHSLSVWSVHFCCGSFCRSQYKQTNKHNLLQRQKLKPAQLFISNHVFQRCKTNTGNYTTWGTSKKRPRSIAPCCCAPDALCWVYFQSPVAPSSFPKKKIKAHSINLKIQHKK